MVVRSRRIRVRAAVGEERPGYVGKIIVDSEPKQDFLEKIGVRRWPTWGCEASEFPWFYEETESAYILEGSAVITPELGDPVTISKGGCLVRPPMAGQCHPTAFWKNALKATFASSRRTWPVGGRW